MPTNQRVAHFLSCRPSLVLRTAVSNLTAVENSPGYVVDMSLFGQQVINGVAHVDIMGAVLAKTFLLPANITHGRWHYKGLTGNRLESLYWARLGHIESALLLCLPETALYAATGNASIQFPTIPPISPSQIPVPSYASNPSGFKAAILQIAISMENVGY